MIAWLAALIPANPVPMVAAQDLASARDRWLRILLLVGIGWFAAAAHWWLAILSLWCLLSWRSSEFHATLVLWSAIAATWFLLLTIPSAAADLITWGWLALAGWQVGLCTEHWIRADWSQIKRPSLGRRAKGLLGSPVTTAFLFALVAPFCPWWGWPVLGLGLWITFSWGALLTVGVGMALLNPIAWVWVGSGLVGALAALWWSPTVFGQRLFEWTPRGDSADAFTSRLTISRLLLWGWWTGGDRWLGQGPGTASKVARTWSSRVGIELPIGEAHNDPFQVLYEMGLLGAAAMVAFAVPIVLNLRLGDPWSAAWVIGVLLSFQHWPWRHPVLGLMLLTISARLVS